MAIKVNRVNRNFRIKVRLYFNTASFNEDTAATPRFFLTPSELLNIEKVSFTRKGGEEKGYTRYGNRFWKWVPDDTLTDSQAEAIFEEIKQSYPYGYVQGDLASTNKYTFDVKENQSFQSFYKTYWENNLDKVITPEYNADGTAQAPYPYIEFITNEIVTYKYNVGTVPPLPDGRPTYAEFPSLEDNYYSKPYQVACNDGIMEVTVDKEANYFKVDGIANKAMYLSCSGRYRLDLHSGTQYRPNWPTGVTNTTPPNVNNLSGYRFRLSTGYRGTHNGYTEYADGISYTTGAEYGEVLLKVMTKTAVSGPGDDGHPYMYSGYQSGYAVSGSEGSVTGVNISGFGFDEGATITLRRDSKYYFNMPTGVNGVDFNNSGHYLQISTNPSGQNSDVYTSGVITGDGYLSFDVPYHAPDTLYYGSSGQAFMGGELNIIDAPAANYTGSIPGESIVINLTGVTEETLHYYSPDDADLGGYVFLKTGCASITSNY